MKTPRKAVAQVPGLLSACGSALVLVLAVLVVFLWRHHPQGRRDDRPGNSSPSCPGGG